jgi:hypothetical protein
MNLKSKQELKFEGEFYTMERILKVFLHPPPPWKEKVLFGL